MGMSAVALDHVQNRRNQGRISNPTHSGHSGIEGDGPYIVLDFLVANGIVESAKYETYGCPTAIACASMVAQISIGRSINLLLGLTADDLTTLLQGIPEGKEYCPKLAVEAIHNAFQGDTN